MDIGIVSIRYAKALLKFADAHNETALVYTAIKELHSSFLKVPRLKAALGDPVLPADKLYRLLYLASGQPSGKCLPEFFRMVIKNRRVAIMPFIACSFIQAYRTQQNIIQCQLTVPTELSDATIDRLKAIVQRKTGKQVDFELHINPGIIGGFILEFESQSLDASVAGRLCELRKRL